MQSFNPLGRNARRTIIPSQRISQFFGLNTLISDVYNMPNGFSPDALNWITGDEKDCLILRRGTKLLGQTRDNAAGGKITGLGVGTRSDGAQVPFFQYGQKLKYYNAAIDDTVEVGSNALDVAAINDEYSISPYQNLAGDFVYITSPKSSIYKIHVASPASIINQASTTYRGIMKFGQSRSILFNRHGTNGLTDTAGLYMSYVDKVSPGAYTQVTGEAVGVSGSKTYANYHLVVISGVKTAFQVVVSATVAAGTETFLDDRNGNLISNFGGTGTVDYGTGTISVTFSDITTGAVTCSYYWEDATTKGVCDFNIDNSGVGGSRVAGSGRYYSQFDGGGPLNAVYYMANIAYSFHALKTWQTVVPTDDNDAGSTPGSNLPYREKAGVSYPYSAFGGTEGIYYINNANPNRPEVYVLRLYTGATAANIARPSLISTQLDLSSFAFDKAVLFEWGNYVLVAFQQVRNGVKDAFNSRMLVYNKKTRVWDMTDYPASRLAEYAGSLIAGDSVSNNVFTLFSGFDDDESIIPNYWTSGYTNHGFPGQKRTERLVVNGLIQKSQKIKVSVAYDGGDFVDIYTIDGTGKYVDTGRMIDVGTHTVGSKIAGGGATVFANPFEIDIPLQSDRYVYIRVRFEALSGGYAQVNHYEYKMIKLKSLRVMPSREL